MEIAAGLWCSSLSHLTSEYLLMISIFRSQQLTAGGFLPITPLKNLRITNISLGGDVVEGRSTVRIHFKTAPLASTCPSGQQKNSASTATVCSLIPTNVRPLEHHFLG